MEPLKQMTNIEELCIPKKLVKAYSLRVGNDLYERINRQALSLKHLKNPFYTKQMWINEAIIEKLEEEEKKDENEIPQEKYLRVVVDIALEKRIEKLVKKMSNFLPSFSKKRWITDALHSKLRRDEHKNKILLEEAMGKQN